MKASHCLFFAERQTRKLRIPMFIPIGLTSQEIEPESNVLPADALSTRSQSSTYEAYVIF